jgi:hypothetical protein
VAIETQTKIGLISKALILCGEKPLVSLSDNRYGATVGANLFELIYENELESNGWRFATTKAGLSQLVGAPLNEWQFAYQLPTDMILPLGVFPSFPYEIYAKHLYTNQSIVELDYMFKPEVADCPGYFCILLVYALARDMIKPITESDTAVSIMQKKYQGQRDRALFADSQGRPPRQIRSNPFITVR